MTHHNPFLFDQYLQQPRRRVVTEALAPEGGMAYTEMVAAIIPAVRRLVQDQKRDGTTHMSRANIRQLLKIPMEVRHVASPSVINRAVDEAITTGAKGFLLP